MHSQYNKKVMKYFLKPKNLGEIRNADGIGKVGNMQCGDVMWIFINVKKHKGKEIIKDIKFKTLGCPAAIASSSVVTELAKGKDINKAIKITNKQVIKKLGALPPTKYHCSLLAEQGLSEAIYDFLRKNKRKIPLFLEKKHKQAKLLEKEFEKKFKK